MSSLSNISIEQLTGQTEQHISWLTDKVGVHQDVVDAFKKMQEAAKKEEITLHIASGFRNFARQKMLWNNKFNGITAVKDKANNIIDMTVLSDEEKVNAILLYSAIPGTSRHHWGTDIDVYAPNLIPSDTSLQLEPWEYQQDGYLYPLSLWLKTQAKTFGFFLPYDRYRGGVAFEPWHLSYAPLADKFQQNFTIDQFVPVIENSDIAGKQVLLNNIDRIFKNYIININNYSGKFL